MAEEEGKSLGESISQSMRDLVRHNGDEVLIHTQTCVEWGLEHESCKGCPSQLGCAKVAVLMAISMTPMMYEPRSYEDYENMQHSMQDKIDKVIAAKTSEEVKAIR